MEQFVPQLLKPLLDMCSRFHPQMYPTPSWTANLRDSACSSYQSFELGVAIVLVTGQHEMPRDALRGDKLLAQRRRKLDILSGGASSDHMADRPAIVVQILLGREAKLKFVADHAHQQ